MLNKEQIDGYIRGAREVGISTDNIRDGLFSQGATLEQISEGFVRLGLAPKEIPKEVEIEPKFSPGVIKNPMNTVISNINIPPIQTPPSIKPYKSKKFGKVLVFFFVFLLLVAGGVYAYVGFIISPNSVTEKAFIKITQIKSMSFDTMITMGDTKGMPEELQGAGNKIIYSGSYNFHDRMNKTAFLNLSFSFQGIAAALEAKLTGDRAYGKLLKAPDFFLFSNLSKYENKWYYTDLDENFKSDILTPSVGSFFSGENFVEEDITEEQKAKIASMFKDARFIIITKKEPPTLKDGMLMHHMFFEPDYEGIIKYFKQLFEFIEGEKKGELADLNIDSFESEFRESMKIINNFQGEIWINSIDGLPYKVTMSLDVSFPDMGLDGTHIEIESNFRDWNEDIQIEAPTDAKNIKEFTENDYGFGLDNARKKGMDANIKATISNLRSYAELYYDSNKASYDKFCNSPEYLDLTQDISENDSNIVCVSTKGYFITSASLQNGSYWCVDSTGHSGEISRSIKPGDKKCPTEKIGIPATLPF